MEPWHIVYYRLAELLFEFHKMHGTLAGSKLFELCFSNERFRQNNRWIVKFPNDFKVRSLDPIHIFASINSGTIGEHTKIERIETVYEILTDITTNLQVDFSGCPSPSVIYLVGARSHQMQSEIWDTFVSIYLSKHEAINDSVFRKIKHWYGVDIGSFTIFLFWIDSSNFLPLDNNTVSVLLSVSKIKQRPRTASSYVVLLTEKETDIYRELALLAFHVNKLGRKDVIYSTGLRQYLDIEKVEDLYVDCKIVALKLIEDKTGQYFKVLKPDTLYQFYNSFNFQSDDEIICIEEKDIELYKADRLRVNISAVVGQNGSGKSTLAELIFLVINNLSKQQLRNTNYMLNVENVSLELYIRTTTLFRLELTDGVTKVYEFQYHDNKFDNPKEVTKGFKLNRLCYTIAINYSHYGLNERKSPWLSSLFHKNDSYQLPLVLNPKRDDGNIDINKENNFVKSRLLANILLPITETESANLRNVSGDKYIKSIKLKIDIDKRKRLTNIVKNHPEAIYEKAIEVLDFKAQPSRHSKNLYRYIVHKLVKIAQTYDQYKPYYNNRTKSLKISELEHYLKLIKKDFSHITFKLRQAINLLNHKHITDLDEQEIEVEDLATSIESLVATSGSKLRTIDLIPPAIFEVEFILSDGSNFAELSSGEKQRIFTVSSLVYHIRNLISVEGTGNLLRYDFVNVIFDEIELYYHPEMQRTFMSFLLNYLEAARELPLGLNICFITHSPLILSDIPNQNILFLTEAGLPYQYPDKKNTFGANIHELLADSFFLKNGFIGDFAKKTIESIIKILNEVKENNYKQQKSDLSKEKVDEKALKATINLIGEKFIREKLIDMYYETFPEQFISDVAKQEKISDLENQLMRLRDGYTKN
jgi:energy-coupling factor transporter ATP-binding protein EcfA2